MRRFASGLADYRTTAMCVSGQVFAGEVCRFFGSKIGLVDLSLDLIVGSCRVGTFLRCVSSPYTISSDLTFIDV